MIGLQFALIPVFLARKSPTEVALPEARLKGITCERTAVTVKVDGDKFIGRIFLSFVISGRTTEIKPRKREVDCAVNSVSPFLVAFSGEHRQTNDEGTDENCRLVTLLEII